MLFYCAFDVRCCVYLLLVAGSTYCLGRHISDQSRNIKGWPITVLVFNALLWATIKWGRYFLRIISENLLDTVNIYWLIPVGISYYMLEAISYIIDIYRRNIECERSFLKYLLYLSYFPKIVQGPISRYNEIELVHNKKIKDIDIRANIELIVVGMIKKG